MKWKKQTQKVLKGNKYYAMVGILIAAILFLSLGILAQFRNAKNNQVSFQTATGATIMLTIEDLKKDVFAFKALAPTSDEKSQKHSEILQKLSVIEQK